MAAAAAALVLTALFALAGHSDVSITLQSALVHAAVMTLIVSVILPRLHAALASRSAPIRWTVKLTVLTALALVGSELDARSLVRPTDRVVQDRLLLDEDVVALIAGFGQ